MAPPPEAPAAPPALPPSLSFLSSSFPSCFSSTSSGMSDVSGGAVGGISASAAFSSGSPVSTTTNLGMFGTALPLAVTAGGGGAGPKPGPRSASAAARKASISAIWRFWETDRPVGTGASSFVSSSSVSSSAGSQSMPYSFAISLRYPSTTKALGGFTDNFSRTRSLTQSFTLSTASCTKAEPYFFRNWFRMSSSSAISA
mmetsp:Transcript_10700/g.40222  ORF Transcript_10700/g.40222 Transcript_10700/m.40222 type:complete len:200 (-) Transcript_10700:105-704(-)